MLGRAGANLKSLRNAVAGQIARPLLRRRSRFAPCAEARLRARRWCRPPSRWMPAIFGRGEPPTDCLPDTFLGLLLGKRKPFARFLVPAGIHYASTGSGRNAAKGPAANGPNRDRT